jgi:hypothetical protein
MLLQDKELVNIKLITIDTNVKEKYLLLQNKGYITGYIFLLRPAKFAKNSIATIISYPTSFLRKDRAA